MTTPSLSIDPIIDARFELVRLLGEGATGAVYLALDRDTGEQVALKKLFGLDQKSVLRFKREFRSLAREGRFLTLRRALFPCYQAAHDRPRDRQRQ